MYQTWTNVERPRIVPPTVQLAPQVVLASSRASLNVMQLAANMRAIPRLAQSLGQAHPHWSDLNYAHGGHRRILTQK